MTPLQSEKGDGEGVMRDDGDDNGGWRLTMVATAGEATT